MVVSVPDQKLALYRKGQLMKVYDVSTSKFCLSSRNGSYALLTRPRGKAALALHVEDNECATSVLSGSGFIILNQDDLSR